MTSAVYLYSNGQTYKRPTKKHMVFSKTVQVQKKNTQSSQPFAWQHYDLYDSVNSQLTTALVKVLNRIGNEVFPANEELKIQLKSKTSPFFTGVIGCRSCCIVVLVCYGYYLSNRPRFLWVYRCDNPRGMLEEHEEKLVNHEPKASVLQAFRVFSQHPELVTYSIKLNCL